MTRRDRAKKIARELNNLIIEKYGLDNSMFDILEDNEVSYEGVYGGIEEEFINTIYHILEQEK